MANIKKNTKSKKSNKKETLQGKLFEEEESKETRGRARKYTQEDKETIQKLRLEGLTFAQISRKIDIPERSLFKILEKKKVGFEKARPIEFEDLKYYCVKDTANIMRLSEITIRNYLRQGKLQGKKIGRSYYIQDKSIRKLLRP